MTPSTDNNSMSHTHEADRPGSAGTDTPQTSQNHEDQPSRTTRWSARGRQGPPGTRASLVVLTLLAAMAIIPRVALALAPDAPPGETAVVETVTLSDGAASVTITPPPGWEVVTDHASETVEMVRDDQTMTANLLGPINDETVAWNRHIARLSTEGVAVTEDPQTGECLTITTKTSARGTCAHSASNTALLVILATSPDSGETARTVAQTARFGTEEN